MPNVDLSQVEWSTYPVDRVESKTTTGWIPDTPTIHSVGNAHYCWPTKLTFAPILGDLMLEKIDVTPSHEKTDWTFLPEAQFKPAPWDDTEWTKEGSA